MREEQEVEEESTQGRPKTGCFRVPCAGPVDNVERETTCELSYAVAGALKPFLFSFDVFDARARVVLQLSSSLPQQKLYGSEITLLYSNVLLKLGPMTSISSSDNGDKSIYRNCPPSEGFKVFPGGL